MFDVIAFDADDTLWQNETLYSATQEKLKGLLSAYVSAGDLAGKLLETEGRNLAHFGYGVKSFTLSMIETAIQLTGGRIRADEIQQVINWGRAMLAAEVQLLPHARETVAHLAQTYRLMLLTKGDLLDQQNKLARSGLVDYFFYIEIVSEKTPDSYRMVLARHSIDPRRFLMVGNSLKSDILPVIALGGRAVYIPQENTWAHELVTGPEAASTGYFELEHLGQLPEFLERIGQAGPVKR